MATKIGSIITIWAHMKENWLIKKSEISDLGIDPKKEWEQITLNELSILAHFLDVTVGDIVD